jgi:5'-3' exoribonuclease 2
VFFFVSVQFFPFHYAPLAEDLAVFLTDGFMDAGAQFQLGQPFEPVGQLMAVLPARSRHAVPAAVRPLMTDDPSSPLAAFYPRDFELDLNHKKFLWQAVALLPFIDEQLLLRELAKAKPSFTPEENARNTLGKEYIFVRADRPAGRQIVAQVYEPAVANKGLAAIRRMDATTLAGTSSVPLDASAAQGLSGMLRPYADASVPSLPSLLVSPSERQPIASLEVVSAEYTLPPAKAHRSVLLDGIEPFVPQLVESDFRTLVEPRQFQQHHHHHRGGNRAYNNMPQGDGQQRG